LNIQEITSVLWRRRWAVAATFAVCFFAVVAITLLVPKTYKATATLFVGPQDRNLDTSQGQQLATTYTTLASNPSVAHAVLPHLPQGFTRDELLSRMSFAPVQSTQLVQISAEGESPAEARRIANTYASVFVDRAQTSYRAGRIPGPVAFSDRATHPSSPVKPQPVLYIGFGLLLSVLLAAGAALALDRFDRRLRIESGDETVLDQPILARIPTLPRRSLVSGDGLQNAVADAFRTLRTDAFRVLLTNLDLATVAPARMMVVTSPGPGEGKTTVATQLALTAANDGERVTLVECDMRRPSLDRGLPDGLPRREVGLSEYLSGRASAKEIVSQNGPVPNLRIVWAGSSPREPGTLLRSRSLAQLLRSLREHSDWVVVDTPPVLIGDDASALSSHVEGTVVVVDPQLTTLSGLRASLNQLGKVRARVLGIVVNNAPVGELASDYLTTYDTLTAPQVPEHR
jgi:capsular exopolysaccharide synthesis family protein